MAEKQNPPQVEGLAADTCEGSEEQGGIASRLERYSSARHRARQVLSGIDALPRDHAIRAVADMDGLASRLRECGEYLAFRDYYTVGEVRLHRASFCKAHLLCPLCAIRRGAKFLKRYLDRYESIREQRPNLTPYLVTFTVKNGDDLSERHGHLRAAYRTLCDRRRRYASGSKRAPWTEAARAEAAVWSFEVTNRGKGWHPHLHAIWLCEESPKQDALRAEWEAITGDSFMVDVRACNRKDPAQDFCEVFKYAVKFSELSICDQLEAFRCLRGKRLLGSFGAFRGVAEPEELTDEPLDGLPYIELFYRFRVGVGYDLKSATPVDPEQPPSPVQPTATRTA